MKKIPAIVFLTVCFSANLFAAGFSLEDFLERMNDNEKKITALEFEFKQDIVFTLTREKQTVSGKILFKKPSSMKFSQVLPDEQYIISNGKKVWIYNPAYRQVIVDSWAKWTKNSMVPASLMNFGNSVDDLKKNYEISYLEQDGEDTVLLSPLKDNAWKLKLWISRDFNISKTVLTGENITVNTTASNYKINPAADDSIFNFKPPQGVQSLEMP